MPKLAKYILIAFAILISLLLIVAGVVAATFNPNDYKPLIVRLVQEKKQRTLAIPGDIKLTFFPKIGADLGRVSISEHNNATEFAAVNSAKVSLELIPLLSKRLVVDRIAIDGITANIKRFKDGTTNFDDLVSKDDTSSGKIKFNIDSVSVTNAKMLFDDQQQNRRLGISNLNLDTGKIANGVPSKFDISANVKGNNPVVDAKLSAKSGFTIDIDQKHYVLKGLNAEIDGKLADFTDVAAKLQGDADIRPDAKRFSLDGITLAVNGKHAGQAIDVKFDAPKLAITDNAVSSGKLSGDLKLSEGARTINASFSMPSFEGSPQAFKLPSLALDIAVKDTQLDAKAKISGTLSGNIDKLLFTSPQLNVALDGKQGAHAIGGSLTTPVSVDLKKQVVDLSAIAAAFTLPNPAGGVLKLQTDGRAGVDLGRQTLSAALKGSLDESRFDAKLGLAKFSPLSYTFDIGIDRFNADRYQAKSAAAPASASNSPAAPEKPIDLSALKTLNATGSLKIGALTVHNVKASNVRLDLHAANGKADINPLAANLYGGNVAGALSVVADNAPRIEVRQNLTGINIGALLTDAIGKKQIDGKGNVQLDVRMQGSTFGQMKKALNGNARLELRDGAIHGVNIPQIIREAKARLGAITGNAAPQTGTSSSNEKTDFSELTGSFRITNGVAHNDDLNVKSPFLRLNGAGDVNIGEDRLDYVVKATVVPSLQGQGGPELQALKGITVPVKLSGPFAAIGWRIDFAGLANELAKQKVEEKKEEVKARVQEKVQEQLKDKLKGLFGN